jgi:HD-GYP domain-containing protein (c-di-GMP phosphodiesterase class II)
VSWIDTLMGRDRAAARTDAAPPIQPPVSTPEQVARYCLERLVRLARADGGQAFLAGRQDGVLRLVAAQGPGGGLEAATARTALSLDAADVPLRPTIIDAGADRWLTVPCGTRMVVRARLRRGQSLPPELGPRAADLVQTATLLIGLAEELAAARAEVGRLDATLSAAHMAGDVALRPHRAQELLFRLPLRLLGTADGGLVVDQRDDGGPTLNASAGRGAVLTVKLLAGAAPELLAFPAVPDMVSGPALGALRAEGVHAVVRLPAYHPAERGARPLACAYYFLTEGSNFPTRHLPGLASLGDQFAQLVAGGAALSATNEHYLGTLKSLVAAMDLAQPYSIGHSDRMARYARLIALELGLPPAHVDAVAQAAYLHDVGMTAIDLDALVEAGRLTAQEYEMVQQHTRVGAELVSCVQSALPLAPMVLHHHERWDGRGYPEGLAGAATPLGARIIAVCDVWEAKTTGRAYRRPLPFDRALADVQALAGTQLDPEAVAALVRVFQRLRREAAPGKPLAPCWQIRQGPASLCGDCPNHQSEPVACWENPGLACTQHGDQCATCVVYTEALSRYSGR